MAYFNKVILVGNLVREPEMRYSASNLPVVKTAIAVNQRMKDKDEVLFIDIVIFGKLAEVLNSYATKGTPILVEGRLVQNRWEDDGKTRTRHEIIVDSFQLLGGKKDSYSGDSGYSNSTGRGASDSSFLEKPRGTNRFDSIVDDSDEDDIPF